MKIEFPTPVKLSPGATRWLLSSLEAYEAARKNENPPARRDSGDERYLTVRQVAKRYGVAVPTVWRWCQVSRNSPAAGNEVAA